MSSYTLTFHLSHLHSLSSLFCLFFYILFSNIYLFYLTVSYERCIQTIHMSNCLTLSLCYSANETKVEQTNLCTEDVKMTPAQYSIFTYILLCVHRTTVLLRLANYYGCVSFISIRLFPSVHTIFLLFSIYLFFFSFFFS